MRDLEFGSYNGTPHITLFNGQLNANVVMESVSENASLIDLFAMMILNRARPLIRPTVLTPLGIYVKEFSRGRRHAL